MRSQQNEIDQLDQEITDLYKKMGYSNKEEYEKDMRDFGMDEFLFQELNLKGNLAEQKLSVFDMNKPGQFIKGLVKGDKKELNQKLVKLCEDLVQSQLKTDQLFEGLIQLKCINKVLKNKYWYFSYLVLKELLKNQFKETQNELMNLFFVTKNISKDFYLQYIKSQSDKAILNILKSLGNLFRNNYPQFLLELKQQENNQAYIGYLKDLSNNVIKIEDNWWDQKVQVFQNFLQKLKSLQIQTVKFDFKYEDFIKENFDKDWHLKYQKQEDQNKGKINQQLKEFFSKNENLVKTLELKTQYQKLVTFIILKIKGLPKILSALNKVCKTKAHKQILVRIIYNLWLQDTVENEFYVALQKKLIDQFQGIDYYLIYFHWKRFDNLSKEDPNKLIINKLPLIASNQISKDVISLKVFKNLDWTSNHQNQRLFLYNLLNSLSQGITHQTYQNQLQKLAKNKKNIGMIQDLQEFTGQLLKQTEFKISQNLKDFLEIIQEIITEF